MQAERCVRLVASNANITDQSMIYDRLVGSVPHHQLSTNDISAQFINRENLNKVGAPDESIIINPTSHAAVRYRTRHTSDG